MIYQIDKEVADQLKEFFDTFNFIDKVVVFGSRARHDCNPKSDIDLCIYSLEMSAEEFTKLKFEIDELPILYKLDLVHFEKSNKELRANIIRDEKLLFQKVLKFDEFFENLAGKKYQISKKDYLDEGIYPIVDQGQKFIVAYSNNEDKLFSITKPVIIFGDHTRAIKYIDFDFIIGADGTKVLLAKDESIDTKYAYYHLLNTKIENLGYSRHFKILKEKTFILQTLTKQKEIASILDKAQELISLRKESIKKLDELSKSIFIDMFGEQHRNPFNLMIAKFADTVLIDAPMVQPNTAEFENLLHIGPDRIEKNTGKILPALTAKEEKVMSKKFLFNDTHILYSKIRPYLNKVAIADFEGLCSADMYPVRPVKDKLNKIFLWKLLLSKYFLKYTESLPDRASIPKLNRKEFANFEFPLPPMELQNKFAKIIEKIEEQKSLYEEELEKLEENFKALLQKSFN